MSSARFSRRTSAFSITVLLTALLFAGCEKKETIQKMIPPSFKYEAVDLSGAPDEATLKLPDGVKLALIKVEAGSFTMSARDGDNFDNEVLHRAALTRDFYLGQTEVTQDQWKAVMGRNPSQFKGKSALPVERVSWNDAMDFCEKLNSAGAAPGGWMFSLPTETQWEYAARGGQKSIGNNGIGYKYSGSDSLETAAWYHENSDGKTHPVGEMKANELGLYDMTGNVCEWCLDDWAFRSDGLIEEFTRGNDRHRQPRSMRGGCWDYFYVTCRTAYRDKCDPVIRSPTFGFRLALVPASY